MKNFLILFGVWILGCPLFAQTTIPAGRYTTTLPRIQWLNLRADQTFTATCLMGGGGGPRRGTWSTPSVDKLELSSRSSQKEQMNFAVTEDSRTGLFTIEWKSGQDVLGCTIPPGASSTLVPEPLIQCLDNQDCQVGVCSNPIGWVGECVNGP